LNGRVLIAGNWKMHKTSAETAAFFDVFLAKTPMLPLEVEIVVAPPFPSIPEAAARVRGTRVGLGAQTMHWKLAGAFTGEVSAPMLREFGVTHVILGHSERRAFAAETDRTVNLKVLTALDQGLVPIVAVGERIEERTAGTTEARVIEQTRVLISMQLASSISWPLVIIVVSWALILFCGFGLLSRINGTTLAALGYGAFAVGSALFMILELSHPFTGVFRVPSGAFDQMLELIGQ